PSVLPLRLTQTSPPQQPKPAPPQPRNPAAPGPSENHRIILARHAPEQPRRNGNGTLGRRRIGRRKRAPLMEIRTYLASFPHFQRFAHRTGSIIDGRFTRNSFSSLLAHSQDCRKRLASSARHAAG